MTSRVLDPILDWVIENLGIPFPASLLDDVDWQPIDPSTPGEPSSSPECLLFGSPAALACPALTTSGMAGPFLALQRGEEYSMLGFWGHGINSYALYHVRFDARRRIYLRIPFGGVYMEPESSAQQAARYLVAVSDFHAACASRVELFSLIDVMGSAECHIEWASGAGIPGKTVHRNYLENPDFRTDFPEAWG